ncbi:MAG: Rne/Rng family ribonuclease [Candidatus Acidiferrales bacterium]
MPKEMVVSTTPHETRVAILEDGQLCEIYIEREREFALVGSIYKGRVTRVLPGMQSAFVDIGLDSDAFLYVSDFLEDIEDYDQVVSTVEEKVQRMEEEGGRVFGAEPGAPQVIEPPDVEPQASLPPPAPVAPAAPPLVPQYSQHSSRPSSSFNPRNRGGRGFGRDRGGERHGGRGGRGRDPRRGRELPASKFASHRPYEPPSGDQPLAEGLEPIILPGESLARFKDRPQVAALAIEEIHEGHETPAATSPETTAEAQAPAEMHPAAAIRERPAPRFEERFQGGFGVIEALPGESIAKAQPRNAAPEVHEAQAESAPVEEAREEHATHEPAEEMSANETHFAAEETHAEVRHEAQEELSHAAVGEPASSHELHDSSAPAELSAEEAAALAEHVAEAQREEEEAASAEREESEDSTGESDQHLDPENGESESIAAEESTAAGEPVDPSGEMESAESAVEAEQLEAEHALGENGPENQTEAPVTQARVTTNFRARMQHPMRRGRGRRDERGRGPRPHTQHARPQQQRRPQLIADMLKAGEEIIIQIAKEPLGKKGARITSHVALPGRYLVYMPTLDHTGVSRKIASAESRVRLRQIVSEAKGTSPGGFIVRTAAEAASDDEIRTDVEFLTRSWAEIKARSEQRKAPALLHRDLNLVERILRDYMSPDFTAIWVDAEEEYTKVLEFVSRFQPAFSNRVKLYTKETPIFEEFGIQQEVDKGLKPKVWLKSGGYIVINHTEALVAIDVNTGKFVGRGSNRLEDTIVRTNLDAVKEIVRQIRLRDLGGIIIIDFIDMEERRNREKVMAALEDALRADRAPSKVLRFNEFGLVAITRKRTKQALERTLCQPCPYCTGSGMVKSISTLCYEIQSEARKMAPEMDSASLTLRVHPEIAKALKTRESGLVEELERWAKKSVIIQADPTLHWEQYDIY